jgi:hypothetical protein
LIRPLSPFHAPPREKAPVDERAGSAVEFPMPAAALRALLEEAIDYAGLFPPANLELEPALQNYAAYLRSPERWMLGAFILPLDQFSAAGTQLAQFSAENPLRISALGPKSPNDFSGALRQAAETIDEFSAENSAVTSIRQFEMPLPRGEVPDLLGASSDSLGKLGLKVFWEAPAEAAAETIAALAGSGAAFKLRTGGVIADAFPSGAQIARALVAAARHKVPIKFTAGLHHPLKQFHESVGTKMHGFLNVLGAAVLAAEHNWSEEQTTEMLADENAESFVFDDESFRWRDWQISVEKIPARREFVVSLGSCSFDEPRDDLRALRLF